jgi:hypothetical protein
MKFLDHITTARLSNHLADANPQYDPNRPFRLPADNRELTRRVSTFKEQLVQAEGNHDG